MHRTLLRKICCSTVFTPSWEIRRKHAAPIWNLCMPLYEFLLRLCCSLHIFFFFFGLMRCCCIAQLNGSWAEAAALQRVCAFKGGVQAAIAAAAGLLIHSIDFLILLLTSRFQSSPRRWHTEERSGGYRAHAVVRCFMHLRHGGRKLNAAVWLPVV